MVIVCEHLESCASEGQLVKVISNFLLLDGCVMTTYLSSVFLSSFFFKIKIVPQSCDSGPLISESNLQPPRLAQWHLFVLVSLNKVIICGLVIHLYIYMLNFLVDYQKNRALKEINCIDWERKYFQCTFYYNGTLKKGNNAPM